MAETTLCDRCSKTLVAEESIDHPAHGTLCDDCACAVFDAENAALDAAKEAGRG